MEEFKKQWLSRALTGGLAVTALLLSYVYVDQMSFVDNHGTIPNPFAVWAHWFEHDPAPWSPLVNLCLAFLTGVEIGLATLPFPDSGRKLVLRSLAHYGVMAVTMGAWFAAGLNFSWSWVLFFLLLLTLLYLLIWLGRWVGWYAEVAAIREKLGLAPGPSLFHWKETLPYVGFAFLLCLILPLVLRLLDDPTPVLSVLYGFLLLPVGGFMSGLSLGRRHGFCPLYPAACVLFILLFIPLARLCSNMADGALIPMALLSSLAGNAVGAAGRRIKAGGG